MIWIPNQLVGASVDTDVTLDCNLESHPKSVTYWTRNTDTIIHQNSKYSVVTVQHAMYKVQMQLMIRRLKPEDFGEYHCVAKNSLGETEGTIKLYGEHCFLLLIGEILARKKYTADSKQYTVLFQD